MLLPSSVLVKIPPAGCRVCLLVLIGKVQWENQKRLSELVLSSGDPVIPSFLSPLLSVVFFFFPFSIFLPRFILTYLGHILKLLKMEWGMSLFFGKINI